MWTLILVIFVAAGTSTGGVSASSAFLDFPTEAKCISFRAGDVDDKRHAF
jgi:hypothetical protein